MVPLPARTLAAQGTFLLERGHEQVVRGILADLVYPATMNVGGREVPLLFSLEGDLVLLVDPEGWVVDTANADPRRPEGWAAGDFATKATMERRSPYLPDLDEHWWTNLGVIAHGEDAHGRPVRGTALHPNEPELLDSAGELFVVERGQTITLARRLNGAVVEGRPRVLVLSGLRSGRTAARTLDPEAAAVRLDGDVVTVVLETTALEPDADQQVLVIVSPHLLFIVRVDVRAQATRVGS